MKQRYAFRILSILLALVLVFELFPTGALALEAGANEAETPTAQEVAAGEPSGNVIGEVTEYRDDGKSTSVWRTAALLPWITAFRCTMPWTKKPGQILTTR